MDEITKDQGKVKSDSNFIVKANSASKPSPSASPYLDNRNVTAKKNQNRRQGKSLSAKTQEHHTHHANRFHNMKGKFHYSTKETPDFVLSSVTAYKRLKVEKNKLGKEYYRSAKTATGIYKSSKTFTGSPKNCEEMKAIGKTFGMTESRGGNHVVQRVIHVEDTHTCKRFSDRWQRMIEVLLENNRAMKVQDRIDLSPAEEMVEENSNYAPHIARTAYKSYLKEKHRNLFTKDNATSVYSNPNPDKEQIFDFKCDSEVALSKIWETHKKKFDVISAKGELGFKSSGELFDKLSELEEQIKVQERLKRIKNMAMSDAAARTLKAKYNTLYSQIELLKEPERKGAERTSVLRQGINASLKFNTFIKPVPEPKELNCDTYLTEVETMKEEDKNEGKIHLGNENFPEILITKFSSQKLITPIQRLCIENLMNKKWGTCKLKIRKDPLETIYHVILYGNLCPISNCCNSLTITKIEKNDGCKVCCMNKLCITKLLDWFILPAEAEEILFNTVKDVPLKQKVIRKRSAVRNIRADYINDYNNSDPRLESSLLNYGRGKEGVGLIIEKKQRMPLIKAKYLSLIVK